MESEGNTQRGHPIRAVGIVYWKIWTVLAYNVNMLKIRSIQIQNQGKWCVYVGVIKVYKNTIWCISSCVYHHNRLQINMYKTHKLVTKDNSEQNITKN